tara:strand:+ start:408 stop:791 length:384 start_codon:yes stop_codon:yes gene_type:complete
MTDKYVPEYAEGEILVDFTNGNLTGDFVKGFGDRVGIEFLEWYNDGRWAIYQVTPGTEDDIVADLVKRTEFVEWVGRRDVKLDRRWDSLDGALDRVQQLQENNGLPDSMYNTQIDNVIAYLESIKEV